MLDARGRFATAALALAWWSAAGCRSASGEAEPDQRAARAEERPAEARNDALRIEEFLADPSGATEAARERGEDEPIRAVLDRAALSIESEASSDPLAAARSSEAIGRSYQALGDHDQARPMLERSLRIRAQVLGRDHEDTLRSMNRLALLYDSMGMPSDAEALTREASERCERVLGATDTLTTASLHNLGLVLARLGRFAEAESCFRRVLDAEGGTAPELSRLTTKNQLGLLYLDQAERLADAEPLLEEVLEGRKRLLGTDHPSTASALDSVAELYRLQGRFEEAKPLYLEALEVERRILGPEHPSTLSTLSNLGLLYADAGRLDEAEACLVQALDGERRVLGENHVRTFDTLLTLGSVHEDRGDLAEAEPMYRAALEGRRTALGDDHPRTLDALGRLAELHLGQFREEEAEPLFAELLEHCRRASPPDPSALAAALLDLAYVKCYLDDFAGAVPLFEEGVALRMALPGRLGAGTLSAMSELAVAYEEVGRRADALRTAEDALVGTPEDSAESVDRRATLRRLWEGRPADD